MVSFLKQTLIAKEQEDCCFDQCYLSRLRELQDGGKKITFNQADLTNNSVIQDHNGKITHVCGKLGRLCEHFDGLLKANCLGCD